MCVSFKCQYYQKNKGQICAWCISHGVLIGFRNKPPLCHPTVRGAVRGLQDSSSCEIPHCCKVRDRSMGQLNGPHQWAWSDTQVRGKNLIDYNQQVQEHTFQQRSLIWPVHLTVPPRRPASQPASGRKEKNVSIMCRLSCWLRDGGVFGCVSRTVFEQWCLGFCLPTVTCSLGWRLFVQRHSCNANSSRRALQPHGGKVSGVTSPSAPREAKPLPSKTSRYWYFIMQVCARSGPCPQSANSWQWLY